MAPENIGSLYPTKMPGYDEAADIQAALRLYHYGSDEAEAYSNTNPETIDPNSIAGHLKSIEDDVATLDARGIGSDFTPTEPTNVPDGFIWVDSDSSPVGFAGRQWVLHDSGNLSGTELEIADLDGETHKIILKDFEISNYFDLEVQINSDIIVSTQNNLYTDAVNSTTDSVISIELANTSASAKPTSLGLFKSSDAVANFTYSLIDILGSTPQYLNVAARDAAITSPTFGQSALTLEDDMGNSKIVFWKFFSGGWGDQEQAFGYDPITTLDAPEFSAGTYEVWSYR